MIKPIMLKTTTKITSRAIAIQLNNCASSTAGASSCALAVVTRTAKTHSDTITKQSVVDTILCAFMVPPIGTKMSVYK